MRLVAWRRGRSCFLSSRAGGAGGPGGNGAVAIVVIRPVVLGPVRHRAWGSGRRRGYPIGPRPPSRIKISTEPGRL